jgi:hypothetical protein
VLFYKRMLGFGDFGRERLDPRVQAPAVLLRLDLAFAQQQIAEMGGRSELASKRRSLYPLFFSPHEEGDRTRFARSASTSSAPFRSSATGRTRCAVARIARHAAHE